MFVFKRDYRRISDQVVIRELYDYRLPVFTKVIHLSNSIRSVQKHNITNVNIEDA